jgi:iron complex outermembrane receptor protein
VRLPGEARGLVSYAVQGATDQQTNATLPNSPRHVAKARISMAGLTPASFVSVEGQYLSTRTTVSGPRVPSAITVDIHVVQPLRRSWELFGGVQNLFNDRYLDPVSSAHRQDAIEQNGRTARIGLRWKFWQP